MNSFEDVVKEVGQDKANQMFMEYMLLTMSKAIKCDQLADALEEKDCTIEQLKEILYDED